MITAWLDHAGGLEGAQPALGRARHRAGRHDGSVEAEIVYGPHLPFAEWRRPLAICEQGSKSDQDQGKRLTEAGRTAGAARVDAYLSVFLNRRG